MTNNSPIINFFEEHNPEIAEKLKHFTIEQRNYLVAKDHYEKIRDANLPRLIELGQQRDLTREITPEEFTQAVEKMEEESGENIAWDLFYASELHLIEWAKTQMLAMAQQVGPEQVESTRATIKTISENIWNADIRSKFIEMALTINPVGGNNE